MIRGIKRFIEVSYNRTFYILFGNILVSSILLGSARPRAAITSVVLIPGIRNRSRSYILVISERSTIGSYRKKILYNIFIFTKSISTILLIDNLSTGIILPYYYWLRLLAYLDTLYKPYSPYLIASSINI